jgi:hypothetical protein
VLLNQGENVDTTVVLVIESCECQEVCERVGLAKSYGEVEARNLFGYFDGVQPE